MYLKGDPLSTLITGGTGSFGNALTQKLLEQGEERVVIFSRDEVKQDVMRVAFKDDPRLRFFLGDVRDRDRLVEAMHGVTTVYHAAALKRVPQGEYNPTEVVKTNILGTMNVCAAAIASGVKCVVALSTDKATSPVNLYGASKLCAEKIVTSYNALAPGLTRFMAVRYGNVAGSRGSVIPLWRETMGRGDMPIITHPGMTRFWITLPEAVDLAQRAAMEGKGGEVFIPHLSAYYLWDLAEALWAEPGNIDSFRRYFNAGSPTGPIRPGEKMHELMLSEDELHLARDYGTHLCLHPSYAWVPQRTDGSPVLAPLSSETAPRLSVAELTERLKDV